jgi:membrane protease YdiL (CAAX protease family)
MIEPEFKPQEPESNLLPTPDQSLPQTAPAQDETTELFQSWAQPEIAAPMRIPHLGHLCLLATLGVFGFACAALLLLLALHFKLFGVATEAKAASEIHYMLGSEAIIYLVTLGLSLIIFPMFWNKSFFAGIQWRGATALRLQGRLLATALGCVVLATLDEILLPGPANAPIDQVFRTPGAAWLMFGFGVTLAPLFEEIFFRGFLLPALATACDWVGERITSEQPRPLDENGHPQWSLSAMVIASIATSLPFALMHAEQTGKSIGPFLLLAVVSLILCVVRLKTRSLAASTLVHSFYNFLLFSIMMLGTGGFRNLQNM